MCKGEDSASTMQKTNCSSFLVWSGKRFFTLNVVTGGAIQSHFHVNEAIFGMVTNKQPNIQLDDPSASLLLTSEKAVFCNTNNLQQAIPKFWQKIL